MSSTTSTMQHGLMAPGITARKKWRGRARQMALSQWRGAADRSVNVWRARAVAVRGERV